jgi:hypothetical protein
MGNMFDIRTCPISLVFFGRGPMPGSGRLRKPSHASVEQCEQGRLQKKREKGVI